MRCIGEVISDLHWDVFLEEVEGLKRMPEVSPELCRQVMEWSSAGNELFNMVNGGMLDSPVQTILQYDQVVEPASDQVRCLQVSGPVFLWPHSRCWCSQVQQQHHITFVEMKVTPVFVQSG